MWTFAGRKDGPVLTDLCRWVTFTEYQVRPISVSGPLIFISSIPSASNPWISFRILSDHDAFTKLRLMWFVLYASNVDRKLSSPFD